MSPDPPQRPTDVPDVALLRDRLAVDVDIALRPLVRLNRIELFAHGAAAVLLAGFAARHVDHPRFVIAALVPCAVAVALLAGGIRQYRMLRTLDAGGAIAIVQQRLRTLAAQRARAARWMTLSWPLLWIPVFIVGMQALFDNDVTPLLGATFWLLNLAFWIAWMLALAIGARRLRSRSAGAPLAERVLDDVAAAGLRSARGVADDLACVDARDASTLERLHALPDTEEAWLRRDIGRLLQGMIGAVLSRVLAKAAVLAASGTLLAYPSGTGTPTLIAPALVAHLLVVAALIDDLVLRVRLVAIDPHAPLDELRVRVERLHAQRLLQARWSWVLLPLLMLPIAIVVARVGYGVDAIATTPRSLWIGYAVFAASWMPLAHRLLHRFGPELAATPAGAWLRGTLAGRRLEQMRELIAAHCSAMDDARGTPGATA